MHKIGVNEQWAVNSHHPASKPWLTIVNDLAVEELTSIDATIDLVRQAMRDVSAGQILAPQRWSMPAGTRGLLALMPGASEEQRCFGVKVLSLFEATDGEPPVPGHQGLMLLFDADDGRPLSIIDANALTSLRTAAASAVATGALANRNATTLAMIGCGEQARWHVPALRSVRQIDELRVWSRSPEKAAMFGAKMQGAGIRVIVCSTVREAIAGADIICTVTRSSEPLLLGEWLAPGQHLNIVGSSTIKSREIDEEAVARGRFVVDSRVNALAQGGELRAAIAAGVVDERHVHAEIGEVLAGTARGRETEEMITIYKSLGHVAQDLAVAKAIHDGASGSPHTVRAAW